MIYVIIYFVGVFVTLIILKYFGKKILGDYDEPKDYSSMDDWDSNAEAYSLLSFIWFITIVGLMAIILWATWLGFIKWFIKL